MNPIDIEINRDGSGYESKRIDPILNDTDIHNTDFFPIKVLLVDDQPEVLWPLINFLEKEGCVVRIVERATEALKIIPDYFPQIIFLDVKMPGMDGLEALERIRARYKDIITFILTGHESIKDAVQAIKTGAHDYFSKPYHLEEIKFSILRALEEKKLKEEVVLLRKKLQERFDFGAIITADPKMFDIFDRLRKISPSDLSVLITGENGTGKELVAQAIHYNSHRKEGPFTPIDCATIPESLFESEVFGYFKGAFTGADQNKKGLFEKAQEGTLFLDELGNLRPEFQGKLLRVIQERKILPLGGKDYIDLNIRLITATNKDLEAAKDKGQFREDLYFRINQYHIHIPSLRERLNDIKLLANHFLSEIAQAKGKKAQAQEISTESLDILMGYSWPGNVRQLRNVIQSASVMAEGKILPEDLPPELISKHSSEKGIKISLYIPYGCSLKIMEKDVLAQAERSYIERMLMEANYQKKLASTLLNISQKTLDKKIDEYNIPIAIDFVESDQEWINEILTPGITFKKLYEKIGFELERKLIIRALYEAGGNKAKAARALEIDYKTLLSKINEFQIHKEDIKQTPLPENVTEILTNNPGCPFKKLVKEIRENLEERLMKMSLRHNSWDKAKTARCLDIDYKTLFNKLRKYGISNTN